MYRKLRDLHLVLGLFVAPLACVYALSALQMAHSERLHSRIETRRYALELPESHAARTPEAAQHALAELHGVRGDLAKHTGVGEHMTLVIERPGTRYEIELAGGRHAQVVEQRGNALRLINRLHHAAGFETTLGAGKLWGALVVLASLALLALGATGICMWLARTAERRLGLWFLGASVSFCLTLLVWIRLA